MVKVENGDYSAALAKAVGDVKACYSLGFVPQSMDGKQHKLEVRVTPPGSDGQSRKLVVRARRGYLAGDAEGVAKAVR
jgi:hypothetical protein